MHWDASGIGVCSLWVLAAVGVLVDLRSKKQIKYTAMPFHHLAAGQVRSSLRASQERYEVREGVHLIESKFVGTVPGSMIMEPHC